MKLVIGTRGSRLALWQAEHIKARILADDNGVDAVELEIIKTRGDKILDVTLSRVGGKGLFVKELEEALLAGRVDLAVHSLKDMPSALPEGLTLACIPERADPRDAWVRPAGAEPTSLSELPPGAIVGTASLRRGALVLAGRPDLEIIPLRGNVPTRLRKLDEGADGMQAIILACAGLRRLELSERITEALDPDVFVPAVGQGALAIEIREDDPRVSAVVARLHDPDTADAVTAERALLARLEGSCQVPLGAHATLDGDTLTLDGFVANPDGTGFVRQARTADRVDAAKLGVELADELLGRGAKEILAALGIGT